MIIMIGSNKAMNQI